MIDRKINFGTVRNRQGVTIIGVGGDVSMGNPRLPKVPLVFFPPAPDAISSPNLIVATFAVWTNTTVELDRMQRGMASWPIPSLTLVRGTKLGTLNFKYFAGMETDPPTTMEEQFDAVKPRRRSCN